MSHYSRQIPQVPPPPQLNRSISRRRSRSRTPPGRRYDKYSHAESSRRALPGPSQLSQGGVRSSPFERPPQNRDDQVSQQQSRSTIQSQNSGMIPSVSMVAIVRTILDPDNVKIPRRIDEGKKQIFDRGELLEGIKIRMKSNHEQNPPPNIPQQDIPMEMQQGPRVVALIPPQMANFANFPMSAQIQDQITQQLALQQQQQHQAHSSSQPYPSNSPRNRRVERPERDPQRRRSLSPPPQRRKSRDRSPPIEERGRFGIRSFRGGGGGGDRVRRSGESRPLLNRPRPREGPPPTRPPPRDEPVVIARNRVYDRTPPPMQPEIRQKLTEDKQKRFNRYADKFAPYEKRGGFRGGGRGRGSFYPQSEGRDSGRTPGWRWEHDKWADERKD